MKNLLLPLVLLLLGLFSLSSCQLEEEKNTPSFGIQTVASQINMRSYTNAHRMNDRTDESFNAALKEEMQRRSMSADPNEEFNIDLRYDFDSEEFMDTSNTHSPNIIEALIGVIGNIFSSIFLGITGPYKVDIDPFLVPVPAELEIDMDMIRNITIRNLVLESEETDFTFLKDIKIDFLNHVGEGRSPLLASYSKTQKGGINKINLALQNINFVPYLKPNENLIFKPKLSVDRVPPKKIHFKGQIIFRVTLKLPF